MNGAIWTMESLLWGHRGGSSPALTRHLACFPVSISPSLVTRWMQTNMDSYQNLEEEKKKKKGKGTPRNLPQRQSTILGLPAFTVLGVNGNERSHSEGRFQAFNETHIVWPNACPPCTKHVGSSVQRSKYQPEVPVLGENVTECMAFHTHPLLTMVSKTQVIRGPLSLQLGPLPVSSMAALQRL